MRPRANNIGGKVEAVHLVEQVTLRQSPDGVALIPTNSACGSCVSGCGRQQMQVAADDTGGATTAWVSVDAKALTQSAALVFGLPLLVMLMLGYALGSLGIASSAAPGSAQGLSALVFLLGFGFVAILCRFVAKSLVHRLAVTIET